MADRVSLANMVFYGYHGAYGAEREMGQRFEVDVDIYTDLSRAGHTDDLEQAVDYVSVYTIVKDIVEEREYNLLETIAEAIASDILAALDVERVTVRVRKPAAPVGGPLDHVEVEITRPA
ncbi:MAG: dihydroneopterin aldolase [Firmicutes bacterium]|nr:dihydroneopterin aldolase [Bacillota bacterium]